MEEEKKVDVKEVKDEKPVEVKTDAETKPEVKVEAPVEKEAEVQKESNEEYGSKETVLLCTLAILAVFLFIIGCEHGEHRMQDSAVRYGAGEYSADTTGHTQFRFIRAKETEAEKKPVDVSVAETVLEQDTVKEEK